MTKKEIFIGFLIAFALIIFIKKDFFFETLPNKIFGPHSYKEDVIKIVLNSSATSLSPYSLALDNLIRTANAYEGLVAFDRNLKTIPSLAVSWGNIDPTAWEFKLRKEVLFHDGTDFNAQSVIKNFEDAQVNGSSEIKSLLSTVKEIKASDSYTIQVVTNEPDPLILSKLTKFYINHGVNIGTGPYKLQDWEKGKSLSLTAFEDYWGRHPVYRNAQYVVTPNKTQRGSDFEKGLTDILVAVPPEQALELPEDQIKTSYSLEVNFLMFKLDDPILSDKEMRENIRNMFDPAEIEEIGQFFIRPVSQFVAPGVFGFNPNIPVFEYDEEKRVKNLFGDLKEKLTLDYLPAYRPLVEYLQRQLTEAGFLVIPNAVSPEDLIKRIKNNESQLYVLGWQAENGDAGDLLSAFMHSEGEFNNGRYKNPFVDKLIDKSRQELVPEERLNTLQTIMELVQKDLIGIPLFESARLYAVKQGIMWEPRLDGLVLATDVK